MNERNLIVETTYLNELAIQEKAASVRLLSKSVVGVRNRAFQVRRRRQHTDWVYPKAFLMPDLQMMDIGWS